MRRSAERSEGMGLRVSPRSVILSSPSNTSPAQQHLLAHCVAKLPSPALTPKRSDEGAAGKRVCRGRWFSSCFHRNLLPVADDLFVSPVFVPAQEDADWEPSLPLCRFHLKKGGGGCAAGAGCGYAHPSHVREVRSSRTAVGVCRYYLSATCRDGSSCSMRHLVACAADHPDAEALPPSHAHAVPAPKKRSPKKQI